MKKFCEIRGSLDIFPCPKTSPSGNGPVQGNTTLGRPVLRSKDNAESALRQAFKVCSRKSLDRTTIEYDIYIYICHRHHKNIYVYIHTL